MDTERRRQELLKEIEEIKALIIKWEKSADTEVRQIVHLLKRSLYRRKQQLAWLLDKGE